MRCPRSTELAAWALLSLSALGCRRAETAEPSPEERGARVYALRCAACHGARGEGRARMGLPTPPDLSNPPVTRRLDDRALTDLIRTGRGAMPGFGAQLSAEEIELVIAHLHSFDQAR